MTIIEALVRLRNDLKLWVINNLRVKVDKEDGKGLSSNDFTTEEKEKLASIDALPSVTVDDNGSLLQVVDGEWTVIEAANSSIKTYVDNYISSALEGEY